MLKSVCQQGYVPFWSSGDNPLLGLFQFLKATRIPWLLRPLPSIFKVSNRSPFTLHCSDPSSLVTSLSLIGPMNTAWKAFPVLKTCVIGLGQPIYSRIISPLLGLQYLSSPFSHVKSYIHQFWGLGYGHQWGALFCY